MKNSSFQKAYLKIIAEENNIMKFKRYIISEDTQKKAQAINNVGQKAAQQQDSWLTQKLKTGWGWLKDASAKALEIGKKLPGVGDALCLLTGETEKGPIVKTLINTVQVAKDKFGNQEVKKFRQEAEKDQFLKSVVKKFGIDLSDDNQVLQFMSVLREQAALAKKMDEDKKFAQSIAAKFASDKKARTAGKEIRKYCPNIFANAGETLKDGTYIIHLED